MPAGIVVTKVAPVEMKADLIADAVLMKISYPAAEAEKLAQYNALESVPVEKKEQAEHQDRGAEGAPQGRIRCLLDCLSAGP